jgi:hypothetical protein
MGEERQFWWILEMGPCANTLAGMDGDKRGMENEIQPFSI